MNDASSVAVSHPVSHEPSALQLTVRQVRALVTYTVRESLHRWTLITYLAGISFFLVLMATAVNLDIVEGTLASARLFGQDIQIGDMQIQVEDIVRVFQVTVISILYIVGVVLALFLTSNYVPALAREGWVDLLVAQPVARSTLLLGRALGSVTVVSIGIAYLVGGSWLVLRLKTGLGSMGFLFAGLVILLAYSVCYTAAVLVGIVTRNSPVSGMIGFMVWIAGHVLYAPHRFPEWRAALPAGWRRSTATALTEGLYWLLPKSQGLWDMAVGAARGEPVSLAPVWYSLPFAFLCLFLACWWFTQRDY